jgi:hypothetical protein
VAFSLNSIYIGNEHIMYRTLALIFLTKMEPSRQSLRPYAMPPGTVWKARSLHHGLRPAKTPDCSPAQQRPATLPSLVGDEAGTGPELFGERRRNAPALVTGLRALYRLIASSPCQLLPPKVRADTHNGVDVIASIAAHDSRNIHVVKVKTILFICSF